MRNPRISQEVAKTLSEMLIAGKTPKQVSAISGITIGPVVRLRRNLVESGVLTRLRRKRKVTKSSKITRKTRTVAPTQPVFNVPSTETSKFAFRVNGMQVTISDATSVNITRGVVEIKY